MEEITAGIMEEMEEVTAVVKEEPRVGVFVCHCGINIGGVVNVPQAVEYARTLPNVVYAEDNLYTCSAEGIDRIKAAIKEHKLNRVVVASCTPRTHEPLFRSACEDAGLNKYLFEFANIREQCSWVHMHEPQKATEKAKDIVRMSVARASQLEPQVEAEVEVTPSALVIGAGISGIMSSLSMANQGFKVYLVEKEADVGGLLRSLYRLYPTGEDALSTIQPIFKELRSHRNITLLTSSTVKNVEGYIGNFEVTVLKGEREEVKFKVGTIIVATGAEEFMPTGMYGYGKYDNVVTQLQLEQMLKEQTPTLLSGPKNVVMIQCVGAREEKGARTYCSRICCMTAVKNAVLIRELNPDAEVFILYQDLQCYGKDYEEHRVRARESGVKLIRYPRGQPPEVAPQPDGKLRVRFYHATLGSDFNIDCDMLVLSTPLVQRGDARELSKMLKVPLGQDGFFLEAHVKLRPVDFASDGIYVCGTAHGPKDIGESLAQAYAVASRAAGPMATGKVRTEAITAVVDPELCRGCGRCEEVCEFGAVRVEEVTPGVLSSRVNDVVCKGCGTCSVTCPTGAIAMRHFTDDQILAAIQAALTEEILTK